MDLVKNTKTVMEQFNLKQIAVAVAIIQNGNGKILITQRSLNTTHPGMWEFPGGKIENQETPLQALCRESLEEVGIEIIEAQKIATISHNYPDKSVILHVYIVKNYQGIASCREEQIDLQWASIPDLKNYEFPAANIEIIKLINVTLTHLSI